MKNFKGINLKGIDRKVRRAAVWGTHLAAILLVCLCSMPAFAQAQAAAGAASQVANIHTLLIFPFDNGAGDAGAASASQLADAIKLRINAVGIYQATTFSVHLPAIERALNVDNTLSADDVKMPITDPSQAQRIARLAGTDGYVLGSLEGMTTQKGGDVRLTVSAELYSTQTGAAVKTVAITGSAAPSSVSEDPGAVLNRALQDAAGKVAAALASGAAPEHPAVVPVSSGGNHNRISGSGALLIALAVALIAVVASNAGATGGGGGGGGSSSGGGTVVGGGGGGGGGPPGPPFAMPAHAH